MAVHFNKERDMTFGRIRAAKDDWLRIPRKKTRASMERLKEIPSRDRRRIALNAMERERIRIARFLQDIESKLQLHAKGRRLLSASIDFGELMGKNWRMVLVLEFEGGYVFRI